MSLPAAGGVDKSRLEQAQDKLKLEQQYDNSLQSTDKVARNYSFMIEDHVISLTGHCEV